MSQFKHNKDSDDIVHAAVITSQKVINLMGKDLMSHFMQHKVFVVNVSPAETYGPDAVTMVLAGKENNIKKSLKQLKKVCFEKEIGIERLPIKSLPPVLKGYLYDMENKDRFEKLFSFCSKEYLEHCKSHNIKPHPEVVEDLNTST
ncbi:MAG: hypothetical protein HYR97_04615 [Candidatus Melainabacteria bacterium]|nr:hypothetical protein [Candidatus Melainabacteria bacterium]MBI3308215.1 hypothetical protein [Candidatus Melainabacteria bacterium]